MKIPNKIKLANLPTPLEQLKFRNKKFLVKRDDYTGTDFSGNKIRKLEYLLYQAKRNGTEIIFTCGATQSNHCRATAAAAARIGIRTKLFLWGYDSNVADGNLFLSKMYGSEISFLNKRNYLNVNEIMEEEGDQLLKRGKKVYIIPEGGSTALGIWGYISFISELKNQTNLKRIKGILCASGTGGTAAGLLVGAAINKLNINIYTANVLYSKKKLQKKIMYLTEGVIKDYDLQCKIDESKLKIIDGYSTEGYKNITSDKLKLINAVAAETGMLIDPTYTGKAFNAYFDQFLSKGKGNTIIFLHTGGLFGAFSKRKKYMQNLS
jgi:D-cysteine desulfhydrase